MSVKIARLKNGDDVISDIKEVYSKDTIAGFKSDIYDMFNTINQYNIEL